jgi:hypothetical protein
MSRGAVVAGRTLADIATNGISITVPSSAEHSGDLCLIR